MNKKLVKLQSRLDKMDAKLEKIEKLASKLDTIEHKVSYTDLALMKMNDRTLNTYNETKETRRYIQSVYNELKIQGNGTCRTNIITAEEYKKRFEELGITVTPPESLDTTVLSTFMEVDPKNYHNITVCDTNYPHKCLQHTYDWYPEMLIDSNTKMYKWAIVKIL